MLKAPQARLKVAHPEGERERSRKVGKRFRPIRKASRDGQLSRCDLPVFPLGATLG